MGAFGSRLKREREQRKVTLDDISASTKISTRMLRALEEEQFEQLPGGIFNKGFVRAYARHVGIDEEQTVADYLEAVGAAQPDQKAEALESPAASPAPVEEENGTARLPWGVFAIVLLILALAFALWGFYSRERPKEVGSATGLPASRAANRPVTTARRSPSDLKPAPASDNAGVVVSEQPASSDTGVETAALQSPEAAGQGPVAVPATGAFQVLIKAREDSWLTVTADGKPIMEQMLVAPVDKSFEAHNQLLIKAGNTGALDFFFNGKRLPVQGDYGEVKILTFDGNGLQAPVKSEPAGPVQ